MVKPPSKYNKHGKPSKPNKKANSQSDSNPSGSSGRTQSKPEVVGCDHNGRPLYLHKKPWDCRNQLVNSFYNKVRTLPRGEMGFMLVLPADPRGPPRVKLHNVTRRQAVAMVEALNKRLPFGQKRLERWIKTHSNTARKQQHRSRQQQQQASPGGCVLLPICWCDKMGLHLQQCIKVTVLHEFQPVKSACKERKFAQARQSQQAVAA